MSGKTIRSVRSALVIGAVMIALLGVAAGVIAWRAGALESLTDANQHALQKDKQPQRNQPIQLVRVFEITGPNHKPALHRLTGVVRARYEVNVAFRINGKILRRFIEVGDQVTPGQLLFQLDQDDYLLQQKSAQANLEVAQAAVQQAVAEEKRLLELRRTNAVSASEYDRGLSDRNIALGRYASAQKQLELADNQLAYCQLKADVAGIVTAIEAESGQVVSTGTRVCTMAQGAELEAVIDIPENRLPRERNSITEVSFWSLPGHMLQARLRELAPIADPITRTYRGRYTLLNPTPDIKLGMTATVHLGSEAQDKAAQVRAAQVRAAQGNVAVGDVKDPMALVSAANWLSSGKPDTQIDDEQVEIPATSLFEHAGRPAVWRVEQDGALTAVPVIIARYAETTVLVSADLTQGQRIVSAGVHKLDSTMRVRPWETRL